MYQLIEDHYREHKNSLVYQAVRFTGNFHNAQDAVQDAYLRALQYHRSFNFIDDDTIDNWIKRIVWNRCKNIISEEKRSVLHDQINELVMGYSTPGKKHKETRQEQSIQVGEVKELIFTKPKNVRDILSLALLGEYSAIEISMLVPETHAAIRQIISRFRKELKEEGI